MRGLSNLMKVLLLVSLLVSIALTSSAVTLVKEIPAIEAGIGRFIVDDMVMCEDRQTMWMVGVANNEDAQLFEFDLDLDKVTKTIDLGLLHGPRGSRGLTVDVACTKAYVINYPINTISVVDLETGEMISEIPAPVGGHPIGVALTYPDNEKLLVATTDGVYVYTPHVIGLYGPFIPLLECDMPILGAAYTPRAYIVCGGRYEESRLVIADFNTGQTYSISDVGRSPSDVVVSRDGMKVYVADFINNTVVTVDLALPLAQEIPVGKAPRYLTISTDSKFVYVANTIDKTVSVISTEAMAVVETIEVVSQEEPAPIGVIAVTKDNRYLYVFYTGGPASTYADLVLFKYDVAQLYGG